MAGAVETDVSSVTVVSAEAVGVDVMTAVEIDSDVVTDVSVTVEDSNKVVVGDWVVVSAGEHGTGNAEGQAGSSGR